jgi:hypothetical protein
MLTQNKNMSQEANSILPKTEPADHEKFDQYSRYISTDEAADLLDKGSTDALPLFMGLVDPEDIYKNKKGDVQSAVIIGTQARAGELHAITASLNYPGLFARGIAKVRGKKPAIILNVTRRIKPLSSGELNDPNSPYRAFYDKESN